ncbi:MAG: hypothetical protein HFK06_05840 [Clostridia bacterium]|nr:hypothetical protein [Clostridia bacterium]
MNLLQALNTISPPSKGNKETAAEEQAPPEPAKTDGYNAMASVLERHEQIANRVRAKN